jgi:hypothetical protein
MRKSTLAVSLAVVVVIAVSGILLVRTLDSRSAAMENPLAAAQEHWMEEDYSAALAVLDALETKGREGPEAQVLRAEILSRSDREAARVLVKDLKPADLSETGRAHAVSVFVRLGEEASARAMLGPVSDEQPLSPLLSLAHAKILLQFDRDLMATREALENALRTTPDLVEAKQLLGRLLFEVGNVLDQIRAKSIARELDAADRLPLSLLGRMLFTEQSPLFGEEIVYFGERLLQHTAFEDSPFYSNLEFYRVMSRRFKAAGRLDLAYEMERARRQHPEANELDLLSYLDVALQTGRLDLVKADLPELARRSPRSPRVDILFAAVANLEGDEAAVMRHLRTALGKGEPSQVLAEAVRYVGATQRFSPTLEVEVAKLMLETEGVSPSDVVIAANSVIGSLREATAVNAVVDKVKTKLESQPAVLATWLRTRGRAEESLEQALRVLATGNLQVLPLVIDLECELGRVEAATAHFKTHGSQLDEFSQDIMRIRLALARGDAAEAGDLWDGAWTRSRRNENFSQMVALCHLSVAMKDYHRLLRSYDPLIANGIGLRKGDFVFLASQEINRGRAAEARRVLEQAGVFYPDDLNFVNDRAYLSILLGEGDYRVIDTMEEIVDESPDNTFFRFTLALAYLVNEFRGEAMEMIESIDFEADRFPHASRAIYAAILWANGHQGPAQLVLNKVDRGQLLPAEKQILEPYLGKL